MITLLVTLLLSIDVFFCFVFFPLRDVNRAKAILCSTYMYLDSLVMEGSKLEYFPHQYFRKNGILEFKKKCKLRVTLSKHDAVVTTVSRGDTRKSNKTLCFKPTSFTYIRLLRFFWLKYLVNKQRK